MGHARVKNISFIKNRWPLLCLILVVLFFPVFIKSYFITRVAIFVAIYAMSVAGMTLIARYAGIVSLGHAAFFAFGAYISSILTVSYGLNAWLAMAVAGGVSVISAFLFTVPFLKLRRVYLVMATLGLGEVIFLLSKDLSITGGVIGIANIPHLSVGSFIISDDRQIFYLIGLFALLSIFLTENIARTRLGRAYHAIRTNEVAAQAMGINVRSELVRVFCFSAFLSSISGSLLAHFMTFISPDLFTIHFSFTILIFVIIGGANIWGAIFTAVILTALSEVFRGVQDFSTGLYGILLLVTLFLFPEGLAVLFPKPYSKKNQVDGVYVTHNKNNEKSIQRTIPFESKPIIEFEGISKNFGGTAALKNVSGSIAEGNILAIIGPNGAGKTTLLNVLNGFHLPDAGRIILKGKNVTGSPPHEMARLGLGRTFQISNLFKGMTVIENVMVGAHIHGRSGLLRSGLGIGRPAKEEEAMVQKAMNTLQFLGLADRAYDIVESLAYGEQKIVEIARGLTMEPSVLLLDEPASGLNTAETEALAVTLKHIQDKGITIIIVEHNMPLVMEISDKVLVLDFGSKLAFGSPQQVRADENVIRAYLGMEKQHA